MPIELLTGSDVPALLTRAQQLIGEDAVVLSVRRVVEGRKLSFEMLAADPVTAEQQRRQERSAARGADVLVTPAAAPSQPQRAAAGDVLPDFWQIGSAARMAPAVPAAAPLPPAPARPRRSLWPFAPAGDAGGSARIARRSRIVALVGPTGSGKTTTIAKLANHPQAFGGQRVGLLCLDTYRIGGVEQSRQYAEISRMPFEVAWEAKDLSRAIKRLRDCDVVLVDTPGRGPRAAGDLRETQTRLLELVPDEVHLVLPAGLQRSLARRIVTAHLPLGVTHLLPTKLDEYPDERGVFELAGQFALPMRWVADGQEVPRDLQPAPETPRTSARAAELAEAS